MKITITHSEFVEGYKQRKYLVYVAKNKAGDFVMSEYGQRRYSLAHQFWSWLGIISTWLLPIGLLFISWIYALISFLLGLVITSAARKSAQEFVLQNMLESEDFWDYALLHGGAEITDEQGNSISSKFLEKMAGQD